MKIEQFFITFGVRAPNLMWLLGAGASASAGIPTAYHLIWQFKRRLYCAAERISLKSCEDISNSAIQRRLQSHFDTKGGYPAQNSPAEYAGYFEAAYPSADDRRTILEQYVLNATPSFGHSVLAALMSSSKSRIIWTTNFDKLIEDAAVKALGSTGRLVVASLDNAEIATQALNAGRWPMIGKLHGDFQSRKLKNTTEELRTQDAALRHALVESCRRFGLIVVGYSGRDESIMHALTEALDSGRGFPAGLFWFHRPESAVSPSVYGLVQTAQKLGIQAELIEVYTFDELMGDILKQLDDMPDDVSAALREARPQVSDVPLRESGASWPVIRTNALPILAWPNVCRKVRCDTDVGNTKSVRSIVDTAHANVVAVRSQVGVLAFGSDTELRQALGRFKIIEEDFHSIEPKRLHFDSSEFGLLRDAFAKALGNDRPLVLQKRRFGIHLFTPDESRISMSELDSLRQAARDISGVVPNTSVRWTEALQTKLDYKLGRIWCLMEPAIFVTQSTLEERERVETFVRERSARRYNQNWNALLDAWCGILVGRGSEITIKAFGSIEGADASFTLARTTGFSRRSDL